MWFLSVILIYVSFASIVISSPTVGHVLHEKRSSPPSLWVKRSKLDSRTVIPIKIGLSQRNLDRAEDFLYDVAHPKSKAYGRHWTPQQVAETFAPGKEEVDAIRKWLVDAGISQDRISLSQGMNWISFGATVHEAERLFKTEYFIFEHSMSGQPHIACHEYHLPAHVAKVVDFVTPTIHFDAKVKPESFRRRLREPKLLRKRSVAVPKASEQLQPIRPGNAASVGREQGTLPKQGATLAESELLDSAQLENCDLQITPNCLRALYGFGPGRSAQIQNTFGIVEYAPQSYLEGDLDKFFANFSKELVGKRPILESVDGGVLTRANESFDMNGEADLDLQIAMPLVFPIKTTLYQVGDLVQGASFNNFLDAIDASYCTFEGGDDASQDAKYPDNPNGYIGPANCGGYAATKVIATSYGYNENDLSEKYQRRQCAEYMKLALQGITVLYSSGDYGVAGNVGRCIDPTTGNYTRTNSSSGKFNPSFPASCPWVTAVGATQIPNNTNIVRSLATSTQPEAACETVIRSGGGFSNTFLVPDYQKGAVADWWQNSPPPYNADRFNNSQITRAYPDVSANGANYVVVVNGNFTLVYGTSASAPTFGAMIALINEERMKKGKTSVGFLNPALYEHPEVMKDVTRGSNPGCGTSGFDAVKGWDPATGLGTPIYPKMLSLFMSLP